MFPDLFLDMFTPVSDIDKYDTIGHKLKLAWFLQINFYFNNLSHILNPGMEFYLTKN